MIHRLIFKLYFDESFCITSELTYHDNYNIKMTIISRIGNYYYYTNSNILRKMLEGEK